MKIKNGKIKIFRDKLNFQHLNDVFQIYYPVKIELFQPYHSGYNLACTPFLYFKFKFKL